MSEPTEHELRYEAWLQSDATATTNDFFLYHNWIEGLPQPVLAHRPTGRIDYVNAAAAKLFAKRRRDIRGHAIHEVIADPVWSNEYRELLSGMRKDMSVPFLDHNYTNPAGETHELRWLVTAQYNLAGEPGGYWAIVLDISDVQAVRREAEAATLKLAESNRDLEDFAFIASHDLQEPLRKVTAFGDRLRGRIADTADEKSIDYLDRIDNAAGRMQILINDLLQFSRVSTKGQPLVPVDLNTVVAGVLSDLEVAIEAAGANVSVGHLPCIDADQLQMRQLFQNLIGNALKFRDPEREAVVSLDATISDGRCTISVSDNGIGFEEQYAEKIFTVFQRLHGRSSYEGTGVGLAVCRKIAERHQGTIHAEGTLGLGSVFTIELPTLTHELPAAA